MTAGRYCNREVIITAPETTAMEAAQLMREHHVGDLVVVEKQAKENMPVGIVTDRDLVIEIMAQDLSPEVKEVKDIMSAYPVSVTESVSLFDALEQMRGRGIRRLVVVNDQGGLEGILCADDVIELIAEISNDLVKLVGREQIHEQQERL
ncbi:MAG: CBS domain-containing protein [Gammaproteobacteria bacterium]|jgi:CBS domain-containing protein|nr:CBS domain-containing protein [Gammaproteobacteria bacterium]